MFPVWEGCWRGWGTALIMYGRSNLVLILKCVLLKTHACLPLFKSAFRLCLKEKIIPALQRVSK